MFFIFSAFVCSARSRMGAKCVSAPLHPPRLHIGSRPTPTHGKKDSLRRSRANDICIFTILRYIFPQERHLSCAPNTLNLNDKMCACAFCVPVVYAACITANSGSGTEKQRRNHNCYRCLPFINIRILLNVRWWEHIYAWAPHFIRYKHINMRTARRSCYHILYNADRVPYKNGIFPLFLVWWICVPGRRCCRHVYTRCAAFSVYFRLCD